MYKQTKYKYIFWDIDDTLINFKCSERVALKKCFANLGIFLSDEDVEVYSKINHGYWLLLEKGEIEKPILLVKRFEDFVKYLNVDNIDCNELNENYQIGLGQWAVLNEHGKELCLELKGKCLQYATTNGTETAQVGKLKLTGLWDIFDDIFISERIGFEKPRIEFFEHCFSKIPNFNKDECIIIGDSLTSDMQGGNNAGITCCWFNGKNQVKNSDIKVDYEISNLSELKDILY